MKTCLKFIKIIFLTMFFMAVCFIFGLSLGRLIKGNSISEIINSLENMHWIETCGAIIFSIASILVGGTVQVILHEIGHLVFGLASGYRFLYFQVFGFAIVNEDHKIRIKKYTLPGAMGQCIMLPPDKNENEIHVIAYNAGGVIFNVLLTLICTLFLFLNHPSPLVSVFLSMTAFAGLYMIIMNGMPMCINGLPNDGHNILRLRKNLKSKKAMIVTLRLSALAKKGTRPRDFPDACFTEYKEIDFKEPLQVNVYSAYAAHLLDKGDYRKCESIYREIIEKEKRVEIFIIDAKCELACLLLKEGRIEEARQLIDEKGLKIVKALSKSMSSKQRFFFFMSLYGDGDKITAERIYQEVLANIDNYIIKGETLMDLDMMKSALESQNLPQTQNND